MTKNKGYVLGMGTIEDYNIDEIAEGAILLDGLEDAIIGVVEEFGNGPRVLILQR
jgi:hypothetical protein